ncbi:uncharacterized protein N7482_004037 [Penicillium canariense]|uniref:Uncharacterized protein n=1 Tax=Penicillium canariense TaxID=189055 RepID=A0A9W9LQ60_9EURO|nr:uncharacterized protein N7482_004037 [Penicillium canariense]KAJ5168443.1 hypothetical protein N7482_004037 [Penicillium canariense]
MLGGFSTRISAASFAFPSSPPPPKTPQEWKMALMEVKRLYLQQQYKQCAAHAADIMMTAKRTIHPIYKAYLSFYTAISYELLGQAAHLYSANKVSTLHAALDSFLDCASTLPASIPLPKSSMAYLTPPTSPTSVSLSASPLTPGSLLLVFDGLQHRSPLQDSLARSLSRMIDVSLASNEEDPFISDHDNEYQTPFMLSLTKPMAAPRATLKNNVLFRVMLSPDKITAKAKSTDPIKTEALMPAPLRIQKASCKSTSCETPTIMNLNTSRKSAGRPRTPPLPLQAISASQLNIDRSKSNIRATASKPVLSSSSGHIHVTPPKKNNKSSNEHPTEAVSPVVVAQIIKFNRGVEFLRSQVTTNVSDIQRHADHVAEIQRARRARKIQRAASFWSFSPVTTGEESEAQQDPEPIMDHFGNILIRETKEQRIVRLRAEGWNTVGLRSPRSTWKGARYYQEFCNMVLNELYLDR